MRARAVLVIMLATVALASCDKKNSLFLEPGRAGPDIRPANHRPAATEEMAQRVASAH